MQSKKSPRPRAYKPGQKIKYQTYKGAILLSYGQTGLFDYRIVYAEEAGRIEKDVLESEIEPFTLTDFWRQDKNA